MRTLHLCAGHGGGLLASLLLGHPIVGAVEYDEFAQSVLRARQRDGYLPQFPIAGDLRQFNGTSLRGTVDLVAGGIPCQGFSGAGKQLGEHDPRNLWPDALRVLRETRAPWFFLENVANLTSFDYWGVILQDLAQAGYDARWAVLSAGSVGAPHLRKRIWLLATDTDNFRVREQSGRREPGWTCPPVAGEHGEAWHLADAMRPRPLPAAQPGLHSSEACAGPRDEQSQRRSGIAPAADMADPVRSGRDEGAEILCGRESQSATGREDLADSNGQRGGPEPRIPEGRGQDLPDPDGSGTGRTGEAEHTGPADAQPDLGGMADGLANRLDKPGWWAVERGLPRVAGKQPNRAERLRGCGNGQVALCAAAAYRLLGGP